MAYLPAPRKNSAIELQAFYLFNAVALFFLGSGKYAMKN